MARESKTDAREIAARTAHTDEEATELFRKVFLVGAAEWPGDAYEGSVYDQANRKETIQEMYRVGLVPMGEVAYEGAELNARGTRYAATYTCKAQPSSMVDANEQMERNAKAELAAEQASAKPARKTSKASSSTTSSSTTSSSKASKPEADQE